MGKKIEWSYSPHYKDDAQGHIFMKNKEGACTIQLVGAASMTQEELNILGKKICYAVNNLDYNKT